MQDDHTFVTSRVEAGAGRVASGTYSTSAVVSRDISSRIACRVRGVSVFGLIVLFEIDMFVYPP